MNDDLKNKSVKGFWWKRFFYSVTGATNDYELGPNWFASVMGTGIIANAAASLPLFSDQLQGFALVVWGLASCMLIGLICATCVLFLQGQKVWEKHFRDPMMAQFYGAPPMAMLTVGGGTLYHIHDLEPPGPSRHIGYLPGTHPVDRFGPPGTIHDSCRNSGYCCSKRSTP